SPAKPEVPGLTASMNVVALASHGTRVRGPIARQTDFHDDWLCSQCLQIPDRNPSLDDPKVCVDDLDVETMATEGAEPRLTGVRHGDIDLHPACTIDPERIGRETARGVQLACVS